MKARPPKRRIADLATIASLLIAVSAMGAWIIPAPAWGRWRALQGPYTSYFADVSGGYLTLRIARVYPDPGVPATARWQWFGSDHSFASVGSITDQSFFSRIGLIATFEHIPYSIIDEEPYVTSMSIDAACRTFVIPLWLIALVAGIRPFRWTRQHVQARIRQARVRQGRCASCGYDLRGSPERCPECGEITATKPAMSG